MHANDGWSEDDYEDDFDEDASDDDEAETITCPQCGAHIYEDAPQCPRCGHYLSPDTSPWLGRPWWWIALGCAGVAMFTLASC